MRCSFHAVSFILWMKEKIGTMDEREDGLVVDVEEAKRRF